MELRNVYKFELEEWSIILAKSVTVSPSFFKGVALLYVKG